MTQSRKNNAPTSMTVKFDDKIPASADCCIVPVLEGKKTSSSISAIDKDCGGIIKKAIETSKSFTGKAGQTLLITPSNDERFPSILVVGLGTDKDVYSYEKIGAGLLAPLKNLKAENAVLISEDLAPEMSAAFANGLVLKNDNFITYKSPAKDSVSFSKLTVVAGAKTKDAKAAYAPMENITQGVKWTRQLANEPANVLTPENFANRIVDELKPLGVKVTVLDDKKLLKMGAGGICGVGQGSVNPPRMVVMEYQGGGKAEKGYPLGFVGKGITFDTGGYSLKPPASQMDMKFDMCGAAAVVGTMKAFALNKTKKNVVAVVALAENMVSDKAFRVNDIITSLSGKTIEVLNTDAEGRLVLADALTLIQDTYKAKTVIDLATLTGAAMIALGMDITAVYSTTDKLYKGFETASKDSGEKVWRMPLDPMFGKEMEGQFSDLKNISSARWAGSCTAAAFLQAFVNDDTQWAHLDLGGVPFSKSGNDLHPAGANGFGVRLLASMDWDKLL